MLFGGYLTPAEISQPRILRQRFASAPGSYWSLDMTNLTPSERQDLLKYVRGHARVVRAEVTQRAQELQAAFERQLAAVYPFDNDETWNMVADAVNAVVLHANSAVKARCAGLGIPHQFTPYLYSSLYSGGADAVRWLRDYLCQAAASHIEAKKRVAFAVIAWESAKIQEMVIVDGLSPDRACDMLKALPTAASLMPALVMDNVAAVLGEGRFA